MGWCRPVVSPLQFVKENGLNPFKNLAQNVGLTFVKLVLLKQSYEFGLLRLGFIEYFLGLKFG